MISRFAVVVVRMMLVLMPIGCAAPNSLSAREEVARQIKTEDVRASDIHVAAMKPILGLWEIDIDATMSRNRFLSNESRARIEGNLKAYPFELEITDRDYVSRSWAKTNEDHYSVIDVFDDVVTISLSSADAVNRGDNRRAQLRIRDGKLVINNGAPFECVLSRRVVGSQ